MPFKGLTFIFALALGLALSALVTDVRAKTGDIVTVHAEGAARQTEKGPDVKKTAIDQALKNAVAEALEEVIERERVEVDPSVIETGIYSNAIDFVVNFKIISEERKTELVEAEGVDEGDGALEAEAPEEGGPVEGEEVAPVVLETYFIWIEAKIDTLRLSNALGKIVLEEERISSKLKLVLLDINDYETYTKIVDALGRIAMLHDLEYGSFSPGRFTMTAKPATGIRSLVKSISTAAGPDFIVVGGGRRLIIIKAYPVTVAPSE